MSLLGKALGLAIVGALASGCAASEARLEKRDSAIFLDGDRLHTGTGSTISSSGGGDAVDGKGPPPAPKAPRANTPPGTDRDGHGPAAGAIVDPTGVTEKK